MDKDSKCSLFDSNRPIVDIIKTHKNLIKNQFND